MESSSIIDVVYVNVRGRLYLHCVGKGVVRLYLSISFLTIVKEDGIRRREMCSVCLQAKDR